MLLFTPNKLLLLAAVLPGLFLAFRINQMDKIEKEPPKLLAKCFFYGVLSIIPALIAETVGISVLEVFLETDSLLYGILENFFIVACAEELSKYWFLRKATWFNPEFDYRFDGVVYAVFVGIGFAVFENITYVFSYGLVTAIIRAVTAVPAHTVFAVFMGHYYGRAKQCFEEADRISEGRCLRSACLVPILLHGFYDFAASSDSGLMTLVFWCFLIFLYVISIRQIRRDSREDMPL